MAIYTSPSPPDHGRDTHILVNGEAKASPVLHQVLDQQLVPLLKDPDLGGLA